MRQHDEGHSPSRAERRLMRLESRLRWLVALGVALAFLDGVVALLLVGVL